MRTREWIAAAGLLLGASVRCASSPTAPSSGVAAPEPVTPAELVASIADVAAGRNEALAESGLVLKRIEFRLAVGRRVEGGGSVEILLLDAEASRAAETSFLQEFPSTCPRSGRGARPPVRSSPASASSSTTR